MNRRIMIPILFAGDNWVDPSTITLNPALLPDGAIPGWTGATFTVSGGVIVNNPTLGNDLLTNGGFETNTTGWTENGTPTCTIVADPRPGSAGANCVNVARGSITNALKQDQNTRTVGLYYAFSGWGKQGNLTTGIGLQLADGVAVRNTRDYIKPASWFKMHVVSRWLGGTQKTQSLLASGSAGQTCRHDDDMLQEEAQNTIFLTKDTRDPYGTTRVSFGASPLGTAAPIGVVRCLDDPANPQNFVLAIFDGYSKFCMYKCVSGTWTELFTPVTVQFAAGYKAILRRWEGTNSFQAFWGIPGREAQVGGDITIDDASIISNTNHGAFNTSLGTATITLIEEVLGVYNGGLKLPDLTSQTHITGWYGNYRLSNGKSGIADAGAGYSEIVTPFQTKDITKWSMKIVWTWPVGTGAVKSFPGAIYGYPWWRFGNTIPSGIPVVMSAVPNLIATFDTSASASVGANFNITHDIWTSAFNPPTAVCTWEIMILSVYVPSYGTTHPNQGFADIDGVSYAINSDQITGHGLIRFWRVVQTYSDTINIKTFMDYCVAHLSIAATDYLADIEFGSEMTSGSGTTHINSYKIVQS
jgi:hypothetical protein